MAYDSIELAVIAVLAVLGAAGGIPQMLRLIKAKPHLKITEATISKLANENYKHQIHLEVQNVAKLLKRNGDASEVTADYLVIDKNGVQYGATVNQMLSSYLCAGTRIQKDTEAYFSLIPERNPYTIVFRVSCAEGEMAKKKITYEATPIIYT